MRSRVVLYVAVLALLCAPFVVGAHEVYVLTPETIAHDIATPSPSPFNAFATNQFQFFFWGFIAFVAVTTIFFASITHRLEVLFEPYLTPMRRWAPLVARVTLGACLIASAREFALFGPELPLSDFSTYAWLAQWALYTTGVLVLLGLYTRTAALAFLAVFLSGVVLYGTYMLNYTNYLGEALVALFLGGGLVSLDRFFSRSKTATSEEWEARAFLVLRIAFGISVAFAAIYAKFLHSNLALSTVAQYNLTAFFPFDPLFIVLGACIIEILMGIFFIVGFEVRHTALFFMFWIVLSLLYFGESVWPHLILVGVNISLFMYGYDRLTVHGRFFNRGKLQPFL